MCAQRSNHGSNLYVFRAILQRTLIAYIFQMKDHLFFIEEKRSSNWIKNKDTNSINAIFTSNCNDLHQSPTRAFEDNKVIAFHV
jgi:hypothetical protein